MTEQHLDRGVPTLLAATERLERCHQLDGATTALGKVSQLVGRGGAGRFWRGEWLGHALHPLLTDLPLGCWLSSALLDLTPGVSSRQASQRLIGLGLLAAVPTAAAGVADYDRTTTAESRRVGLVHAAGNVAVLALYAASWTARRRQHHVRGVLLGLLGGVGAVGTGYLGGHLSFARGVGTGARRGRAQRPVAAEVEELVEAGATVIGEDEGELLLEGPNTR
jgi:uncharacterized membrane protein